MIAFGGKGSALLSAVIGSLLAIMIVSPSMAAAIAQAVEVRPEATGIYNGTTLVLSARDDLFEGQTISTGPVGQVQIVFADDTHMVVGPGSSLVIEKYLMRNGGTASEFAVNALGGTFRFITGKSNKDVYRIDTPTGTIGVRGTKFDFTVTSKRTNIMLFEGEVSYCPSGGGDCTSVTGACDVGAAEGGGAQVFSKGGNGHSADNFLYVKSQRALKTAFKVKGADACGGGGAQRDDALPEGPTTPSVKPPKDTGGGKPPGKPDPVPDPVPDPLPD